VLREILREETLFDIPQSDISLAELEALTADDTKGTDFRTGTQGLLAIEISPLVTATVRWPPKQPDQAELFGTEESVDDFRDLAIQLDDLRSKMAQIQKRITRIIEGRESSEWRAGRGRRR